MSGDRSRQSAPMAPLHLLAALLAALLQLNFGQQINEGNNLVAVASHKLAAIKQQSQKQNVTDADQTVLNDSEDNLEGTSDSNVEQVNLNTSTIYPGSGTITSIKFVRNPAYDGPLPTFSIINSENASIPISGTLNYDTALFNLTSASPRSESSNTAVAQVANQQAEGNVGFIGKSPVFISLAPRCSGTVSSHSPYIINALSPQSSSSNTATLQQSPPPEEQSHQTLPSTKFQSTSVQNPANMRLRFVPAPTAASLQSTMPVQSTVSMQRKVPVQNTIQNTATMQTAVPIQSTLPIQSALPIQSTVPIQSTIPIQRTVSNVPIQNPIANIVQNPNLSLLLTHILSQNPVKQEYFTPTDTRCAIQEQKPSKQNAFKTLLPLLLQLLTEKNNNCCEYKNKRSRTCHSRYKPGYQKGYDKFDADLGRSDANQFHRVNQNKRLKRPFDDTLEEEDYSDETSDYTAEEYDDED